MGRALGCESGHLGFGCYMVQFIFIEIDHEILSSQFALYLCSGMYRSYHLLAKVKTTSTGTASQSAQKQCGGWTVLWLTTMIQIVYYQHHHHLVLLHIIDVNLYLYWCRNIDTHKVYYGECNKMSNFIIFRCLNNTTQHQEHQIWNPGVASSNFWQGKISPW
jgi:hypothetical protein